MAWRDDTQRLRGSFDPSRTPFEATYRVYIGNDLTGAELMDENETAVYGSDLVTFRFDLELIGDFDESGFLDPPDIDLLSAAVRSGEYEPDFDLTEDDELSDLDRSFWIEELVGTLPGDADLNGGVDFDDFLSLASGFGEQLGWATGDFDGDEWVTFDDFLLLAANFGQTKPTRPLRQEAWERRMRCKRQL